MNSLNSYTYSDISQTIMHHLGGSRIDGVFTPSIKGTLKSITIGNAKFEFGYSFPEEWPTMQIHMDDRWVGNFNIDDEGKLSLYSPNKRFSKFNEKPLGPDKHITIPFNGNEAAALVELLGGKD